MEKRYEGFRGYYLQMKKSVPRTVSVLAITIAIFYLIFTKIDFFSVVKVLSHANLFYLLSSLLPLILSFPIWVKRWQTIIEAMGYPIPFVKCFNILMASVPLASVTPTKSGDVIRAYYLKDEIPPTRVIGSVLTERIFDIFVLISFSLIGMVFYQKYEFISIIFGILIVLIVLIFILHTNLRLSIKESWNEKLQNIAFSMKTLTKNKKSLFTIILYSFLYWILGIAQTLMFFYALEIDVPLLFTLANIPIAIFIGLIPVTLGGMGTRDAAIIFLFSEYATSSQLLGVGILFSVFRYWFLSLLGIPFMKKLIRES